MNVSPVPNPIIARAVSPSASDGVIRAMAFMTPIRLIPAIAT